MAYIKRNNPVGRPKGIYDKFTPKVREAFLEGIELGLSQEKAANLAGVSYEAILSWRQLGEKEDALPKFRKFLTDYKKAKDQFIENNLKIIRTASKGKNKTVEIRTLQRKNSKGEVFSSEVNTIIKESNPDWHAAAWLLERMRPDEFSQHRIIEDNTTKEIAQDLQDIIGSC